MYQCITLLRLIFIFMIFTSKGWLILIMPSKVCCHLYVHLFGWQTNISDDKYYPGLGIGIINKVKDNFYWDDSNVMADWQVKRAISILLISNR